MYATFDDGRRNGAISPRRRWSDCGVRRARLVEFIGANPEVGDLIPESGGVRKLRWALPGGGKRGGARVIYFFHSERLPVFLLAMYGKNEKANLSLAERNDVAKFVKAVVREYPKGRGAK